MKKIYSPADRTCLLTGLLFICALTSGCAGNNVKPLSPDFGNATQQNMANEIVNPDPSAPSQKEAAVDGQKVVLGVDAYKKGKVKEPEIYNTTSTGGGGGGSSSGGTGAK